MDIKEVFIEKYKTEHNEHCEHYVCKCLKRKSPVRALDNRELKKIIFVSFRFGTALVD